MSQVDVPLHQHWHDVHRKRWLILLTGLAAALVAGLASRVMTPVYEARTTFYLAANAVPFGFSGTSPDAPQPPLLPVPEEKAASLDVGILRGAEMMGRLAEATGQRRADLERAVDVTVSNEFMVDVYVRDPDPRVAARIANEVPDLYAGFHEQEIRARAETRADALSGRLGQLRDERARILDAVQRARADSLSSADASALETMQQERDEARKDLLSLEARTQQVAARVETLESALSAEATLYLENETTDTTATLDLMLQRVLDLQVELASITTDPSNTRRNSIDEQISAIRAAMEEERERLRTAAAKPQGSLFEELRLEKALADADLAESAAGKAAATARLAELDARFNAVLAAVGQTDMTAGRLDILEGEIAATEQNLAAAELQSAHARAPVVVVAAADPPGRPAFPLPLLNTVVAGLTGLIFGAYYALWVAHAERGAQARRTAATQLPYFTEEERRLLSGSGVKSWLAPGAREGGEA